MALQTPQRGPASEPFVTLSLPKISKSLPVEGSMVDTISATSTPTINSSNSTKVSAKKITPKRRSLKTLETPKTNGQRMSPNTSPTSTALRSKILILKYGTPLKTAESSQNDDSTIEVDSPVEVSQLLFQRSNSIQSLDGTTERRSSTASLTDTGTRSSARTRKLTVKAQALAGSNFLPSLQSPVDSNLANDRSDPIIPNEHDTVEVVTNSYDSSRNISPEITTDHVPVIESVETPVVRSSTRERKPTARLVQLETTKTLRKRPASPLTIERPSKLPKTSPTVPARAPKLNQSTTNVGRSEQLDKDNGVDQPKDTIPSQTHGAVEDQPNESLKSSQFEDVKDTQDTVMFAPQEPDTVTKDDANPSQEERTAESTTVPNSLEAHETDLCKLTCLSPDSRLIAFAKFASDWPESDSDEDDNDVDIEDETETLLPGDGNSSILDMMRKDYCRCGKQHTNGVSQSAQAGTYQISGNMSVTTAVEEKSLDAPSSKSRATRAKKSSQEKTGKRLIQPERHQPKRVRSEQVKPALKRHNSGFEQRMQADYLALEGQKTSPQVQSPQRLNEKVGSTLNDGFLPNEALSSHVRHSSGSAFKLTNGLHLDKLSNIKASGVASLRDNNPGRTKFYRDMNPHPAAPLKPAKSTLDRRNQGYRASSLAISINSSDEKVSDKPTMKSAKIGTTKGGRSSLGEAIHLTLEEQLGQDRSQIVKTYQSIAPPQAKSIKLKFRAGAA